MYKFSIFCVFVVALSVWPSSCVPQGRRVRQEQQPKLNLDHKLDPVAVDQEMNAEHAKLIENLQRLKRTLDHVKERVGKGTYGETAKTDIKNPEGAILTVLKSLQEQGQLFSMINDMLKAGSEVQNQTAKISATAKLQEEAHAEAAAAVNTNQITAPVAVATSRRDKHDMTDPAKQHGYDDYQYQYRDDSGDATGFDQYEYQYDAGGYDEAPSSGRSNNKATTTTTTTTTRRPKRVRSRGKNDYY